MWTAPLPGIDAKNRMIKTCIEYIENEIDILWQEDSKLLSFIHSFIYLFIHSFLRFDSSMKLTRKTYLVLTYVALLWFTIFVLKNLKLVTNSYSFTGR